jgi:hypothetical protein
MQFLQAQKSSHVKKGRGVHQLLEACIFMRDASQIGQAALHLCCFLAQTKLQLQLLRGHSIYMLDTSILLIKASFCIFICSTIDKHSRPEPLMSSNWIAAYKVAQQLRQQQHRLCIKPAKADGTRIAAQQEICKVCRKSADHRFAKCAANL